MNLCFMKFMDLPEGRHFLYDAPDGRSLLLVKDGRRGHSPRTDERHDIGDEVWVETWKD